MGYDAALEVDVGGSEPARLDLLDANYTTNCGPMLVEAVGISLGDLSGQSGHEVAEILDRALSVMEVNPDRYRALNPENGWGDFEGWRRFLTEIRDACRLAPDARFVA